MGGALTIPLRLLTYGRHDFEIVCREAIKSGHCVVGQAVNCTLHRSRGADRFKGEVLSTGLRLNTAICNKGIQEAGFRSLLRTNTVVEEAPRSTIKAASGP